MARRNHGTGWRAWRRVVPLVVLPALTPSYALAQVNPVGGGPVLSPSTSFPQRASQFAALDLSSTFLNRLIVQAGAGYAQRLNAGGGGASSATEPLRYRNWFEFYGQSAKTDAQGNYVGDSRRTVGGIAGFGATIVPGLNIGLSVDQSASKIDLPLAAQAARFDLTQLGINGSFESGPWMLAFAAVHGFGRISSERFSPFGDTTAGYRAELDGALVELSYYWSSGQARVVPKLGAEYVRAATDGFTETGPFAVTANASHGERTRILAGAEIGHYWIVDQRVVDISGYGKFVDNISQNMGDVSFASLNTSFTAQGLRESTYGADAGAAASFGLNRAVRFYLAYDGKFRENFRSHVGTLGLEVKW